MNTHARLAPFRPHQHPSGSFVGLAHGHCLVALAQVHGVRPMDGETEAQLQQRVTDALRPDTAAA